MKTKSYVLIAVTLGFSFAALILSTFSQAKEITMYDQPKADAKVVGAADLSSGIVPIFTPKSGDWVKIADPRNGNVGWVKSSELTSAGSFTFTQRFINNGKGPQTYQIIQYGQPQKNMTTEEVQNMVQKMQTQQNTAQESMQKAVQDMMKNMGAMYQQQWETMQKAGVPIIMPIVIMPQKGSQQ